MTDHAWRALLAAAKARVEARRESERLQSAGPVDLATETAYGSTARLSFQIRVF